MSSNVGLPTPRGSGTSGYVQRNWAFLKPRNAGYGAPYPPVSSSSNKSSNDSDSGFRGFKQRQPDKQILEHDRRRAVEVEVLELRERLEEENEVAESQLRSKSKSKDKGEKDDRKDEGDTTPKILTEEEIDERCDELRRKLLKELEEEQNEDRTRSTSPARDSPGKNGGYRRRGGPPPPPRRERKQFKSYQIHELAEAKIEESERLRRALGIKDDWEREKDRERETGGSRRS